MVADEEKRSSLEVEDDCSILNNRGGVSHLGKSTVHPVEVNNCFDGPQSYDAIAVGDESCTLAAVAEVASCDSTSDEASFGGQLATASEPRIFHHLPCTGD